jgi:hypothetical protein
MGGIVEEFMHVGAGAAVGFRIRAATQVLRQTHAPEDTEWAQPLSFFRQN